MEFLVLVSNIFRGTSRSGSGSICFLGSSRGGCRNGGRGDRKCDHCSATNRTEPHYWRSMVNQIIWIRPQTALHSPSLNHHFLLLVTALLLLILLMLSLLRLAKSSRHCILVQPCLPLRLQLWQIQLISHVQPLNLHLGFWIPALVNTCLLINPSSLICIILIII